MWAGLLHKVVTHLWSYDSFIVLLTWFSAATGAAITYVVQIDEPAKSLRGFGRFMFPSVILRHPSCRLDAVFSSVMHFLHMPVFLMVSNLAVAELSYAGLAGLFGARPQNPEPFWLWIIIMAVAVVVQDFMTFWVHVQQHRRGWLWELHKVHHSTEFLLPISNRRFHPLQAIVDNFGTMVPVGLILGVTAYAFALPVHDNSVIGLDALFVLNMLSFYHLRHSHVPMRYGWFERHMISPAQHQLHHSREERHWDRNFGLCFSWWDRWLGTLVYSVPGEQFALGLPRDVQPDYDSPLKLFVVPVRNIGQMLWQAGRRIAWPGDASVAAVEQVRDPA